MTCLLQPLDPTTSDSLKKIEKRAFSKYFSSSIMEVLKKYPTRDLTTIYIDLLLSVLRPLHVKAMKKAYQFFKSLKGKEVIWNRWKAAGITETLRQAREKNENSVNLNPVS